MKRTLDVEPNINLYTNGLTCNIHDYIQWAKDVSLINKKDLNKLKGNANYFIAYSSYIAAFDLEDTPEFRKQWYKKMRDKIFLKSIQSMGI